MARAMQLYHAHPSRSTRVLHFLYELQATSAELPPLEVRALSRQHVHKQEDVWDAADSVFFGRLKY